MKGAFVVDLKGILRVSLYKLVELNKDELAVLLNKIGSAAADNAEQKTELDNLGKRYRLAFGFTHQSALNYIKPLNIFPERLFDTLEDFQIDGLVYLEKEITNLSRINHSIHFSFEIGYSGNESP